MMWCVLKCVCERKGGGRGGRRVEWVKQGRKRAQVCVHEHACAKCTVCKYGEIIITQLYCTFIQVRGSNADV